MNVVTQKAMVRIRLRFEPLRATAAALSPVTCWNVLIV
jgi:hypothetical protein